MYIIRVMISTFSIRDFGHPKFLIYQFGDPVMKILARSLDESIPCPHQVAVKDMHTQGSWGRMWECVYYRYLAVKAHKIQIVCQTLQLVRVVQTSNTKIKINKKVEEVPQPASTGNTTPTQP